MRTTFKTLMTLLVTLLLMTSCGSDKAKKGKSSTTIKLFTGNLLGTASHGYGGVMIWGHRMGVGDLEGGDDIGFAIRDSLNEAEPLILPKGTWEFYAIAWEGNGTGAMTGRNRCGYATQDLINDDETVGITLSTGACAEVLPVYNERITEVSYLDDSNSYPYGTFRNLEVRSCNYIEEDANGVVTNLTTVSTDCTSSDPNSNQGIMASYKVYIMGHRFAEHGPHLGLASRCINEGDSSSGIRIPVGDMNLDEAFIQVGIESFPEANCGGTPIRFHFENGIGNGFYLSHPHKSHISYVASGGNTVLHVEHNTETRNVGGGGEYDFTFGSGRDGDLSIGAIVTASSLNIYYGKVDSINSTGTTVTLNNSISSNINNFHPGDEIMWYVSSEGEIGCTPSGATYSFMPGMYDFTHIASVDAGNFTFTLHRPINQTYINNTEVNLSLPTNLANTPAQYTSGNFCSIQVIRVPHFNNLTLNPSYSTDFWISPDAYSHTSGTGGILPFRVANTLNIDVIQTAPSVAEYNININASEKGFVDTSFTPPATFYDHCSNGRCIKMGTGTMYNGGGGILIFANNLNITKGTTKNVSFLSQGSTSDSSGANDGGEIYLNAKTINLLGGGTAPTVNTDGNSYGGDLGGISYISYCSHQSSDNTLLPTWLEPNSSGSNGGVYLYTGTDPSAWFCQ